MSQDPDVFRPVHRPTRREEDRRKAEQAEKYKSAQPVKGRPGLYVKEGKLIYDPMQDPEWTKAVSK